jgi:small-conductance mechanosensitive channel
VALAAQNVLGYLLASLSIILDKPFLVGDFIVVENELGTIEKIGVKTTRVRALSGEEVVFSNKDLLEHRIHNYKSMRIRRVVQSFSVPYGTPTDLVEKVPGWVKGIIEKKSGLKFDRCHLAKFGPSSLDYEFVFYVKDPDYNKYMDLQQEVLLQILRRFEAEKVQFALPVRRLLTSESLPEVPLSPEPAPRAEINN